jgi:hypothetical protein
MWNESSRIRSSVFTGPFKGAALILSSYGNLEVVVTQADGALAHFWLYGDFGWRGPTFLPGKASGPPAFIQSRFGRVGNYEVIVPRPGGGLSHFWRDNDGGEVWHEGAAPVAGDNWSGLGLIHSNFGHLEIVGARNGRLQFLWQERPGGAWSAPQDIDAARATKGRPAFIQSSYGVRGNFEVVALTADGRLVHYWRNNDAAGFPWSTGTLLSHAADAAQIDFNDVTMIQSSYGRLEVISRASNRSVLMHYRAALGQPWEGPIPGPAMGGDGSTFQI